jgi:hypothetical protein
MGSLAKLDEAAVLLEERRGALVRDLEVQGSDVDRMVQVFREDIVGLNEPLGPLAERVLDRARLVRAYINNELVLMRTPELLSQTSWWRARGVAVLTIGGKIGEISEDMIGLLEDGALPSEQRATRQLWTMAGLGALFGLAGYGVWLWTEKNAEAEQTRMIESGEIEDCGCGK